MPMSQGAASSGPVNTTGSTTAAVRLRPSLLRAVGIQGAADAGVAVASRLNASAMTNVRFISLSPMRSRARGMRRFSQDLNDGPGSEGDSGLYHSTLRAISVYDSSDIVLWIMSE